MIYFDIFKYETHVNSRAKIIFQMQKIFFNFFDSLAICNYNYRCHVVFKGMDHLDHVTSFINLSFEGEFELFNNFIILFYVFGFAEAEVHSTPSCQVFDITSKSLNSHLKIKNNFGLGGRQFSLYVFGVAGTKSEVHFTPSCQVFDIKL